MYEGLLEFKDSGAPCVYLAGDDLLGRLGEIHAIYKDGTIEYILEKRYLELKGSHKIPLHIDSLSDESREELRKQIYGDSGRSKLKSSDVRVHAIYDKEIDKTYYFMLARDTENDKE